MAELTERIFGTEMEYPIDIMRAGSTRYRQTEKSDLVDIQRILPPDVVASKAGGMLSNGARYYVDVGDKLEYATPEDTSLWGTVAAEHAGEAILAHGISEYIANHDEIRRGILEKRVYGDDGDTWGYHVNLSADAKKIPSQSATHLFKTTMHLLALHLATYNLYAGAGTLFKDRKGAIRFSLSQKSLDLSYDFNNGTMRTQGKPLINLRNEPHAPEEELRRIHITSADPNISPWASWMTLGTNSLILRAIEQGRADKNFMSLKSSIHYIDLSTMTATDLTFSEKAELADGTSRTPLEIQKSLFEIASKTYHTDQEAEILREWERTLSDLESDPMRLRDRSDAIAKYDLMQKHMERRGVDLDDSGMKVIDHGVGTLLFINKDHVPTEKHPETPIPLGVQLRQGRWKNSMTSDDELERRVTTPPQTTRAHQRGRAIKKGDVSSARWGAYTIGEGSAAKSIEIAHPLKFDVGDADPNPEDRLAS